MKLLLTLCLLIPTLCALAASQSHDLTLRLRTRKRSSGEAETEVFDTVEEAVSWPPAETVIVVCDMWNQHWCRGATARVEELTPRMNEVLHRAREQGVFIIHAPSGTLAFYADTPQRRLAQEAPSARPPDTINAINSWHSLDPAKEPPLPIDDSDGGCDDVPPCPVHYPWTRQHAALDIAIGDAISDQGDEVYNLLRQRGITNVIVMGVHTNMCVLGRPFSIRRLVTLDFQVALMRDMTDTMYNSRMAPYVNHFRGTDLVIEHIEKYWCPTFTSADLTGQPEFKFNGS
jgi:nicotinamidase-related amidase